MPHRLSADVAPVSAFTIELLPDWTLPISHTTGAVAAARCEIASSMAGSAGGETTVFQAPSIRSERRRLKVDDSGSGGDMAFNI